MSADWAAMMRTNRESSRMRQALGRLYPKPYLSRALLFAPRFGSSLRPDTGRVCRLTDPWLRSRRMWLPAFCQYQKSHQRSS